jgi:hypothetical protein
MWKSVSPCDQAAVDECKSWPAFDCKGLELSRDIYNFEVRWCRLTISNPR